jgi:spore coat-associated protein N
MMKKLLISLMTVVAVTALVGGGIYAYFSDVETSNGNTFTAGTLDLNLDSGNINVVKFNVGDVKPGDTGGGTWTVTNVGNIAGYLDLENCSVSESVGTTTDPELADEGGPDTAQLGNYLMVHIFVDDNNNGIWDLGEADILGTDALPVKVNTIAASYDLNISLTGSGGITYITLTWSVPVDTDNRIQGDSVTLNIGFELQQRAAD